MGYLIYFEFSGGGSFGKGLNILAFYRYVKKEQREVKRELMLVTKGKMECMSTTSSGSDSSKNRLIPSAQTVPLDGLIKESGWCPMGFILQRKRASFPLLSVYTSKWLFFPRDRVTLGRNPTKSLCKKVTSDFRRSTIE